MRPYDPARGGGGRRAGGRLVALSRLLARADPVEEETALVYGAGLRAARLLRQHFPALYAEHVGGARVTPGRLLATIELFLVLANRHLLEIEERWELCTHVADPLARFRATSATGDEEAAEAIVAVAAEVLDDPVPVVYGLDWEWEDLAADTDYYRPALCLWGLVRRTGWAVYGAAEDDGDAPWHLDPLVQAALAGVPALAADVDLDKLCERLDEHPIAGERLGQVLRYVCRQVDNAFATLSPEELAEMYGGSEVDWTDGVALAAMRADQQAAQALAETYGRLAHRVDQEPRLLAEIAGAITAAAKALGPATPALPATEEGEAHDRDPSQQRTSQPERAEPVPAATLAAPTGAPAATTGAAG